MEPLTMDRALALLDEVVDEMGEDFVYRRAASKEDCYYTEGGQPSCIVGHVLVRAGLDLSTLSRFDGHSSSTSISASAYQLPQEWFETVKVREALGVAQAVQDVAYPWGAAKKAAHLAAEGVDDAYYAATKDVDRESVANA